MVRIQFPTIACVMVALAMTYHYAALAEAQEADKRTKRASEVTRQSKFRPAKATVRLQDHKTTVMLTADSLPTNIVAALRPSRLQVFENGVRQPDVNVAVEHVPISLAVLIEMGGRSYELNRILASEAPHLLRRLIDRLGPDDKLAVATYGDEVRSQLEFGVPREAWAAAVNRLEAPRFSESNLHDATIQMLDRMRPRAGRRALMLVTTGIDTFSRATFDNLLTRAREARTPIYCLSLADLARNRILDSTTGPLARVDWNELEARCERLAEVSGGRAYPEVRAFNAAAILDGMLERLRLRYVLSYESTAALKADAPREIEVRLIVEGTAHDGRTESLPARQQHHVIARAEYPPDASTPSSSS